MSGMETGKMTIKSLPAPAPIVSLILHSPEDVNIFLRVPVRQEHVHCASLLPVVDVRVVVDELSKVRVAEEPIVLGIDNVRMPHVIDHAGRPDQAWYTVLTLEVHEDEVFVDAFLAGIEVDEGWGVSETLSELVEVVMDIATGVVAQLGEAG